MNLIVVLIALVPLYGILFPPLTDLPHHILVNKLLWEKLFGVSNLDLEVSSYLGYRLPSVLIVILITVCKLFGLSLVYLPNMIAIVLMSVHAVVVVTILYLRLESRSWRSSALAACLALPAVAAMYSACWFMGFVGYTLAITLLVPAIFFMERFVRSGKRIDAIVIFVLLALIYASHPFALAFWLLWLFSRMAAAVATRTILLEWKRLILTGLFSLPIFLYHFLITAGTGLGLFTNTQLSSSPFVSTAYWLEYRLGGLLNGTLLQADAAADSRFFGIFAVGLILGSTFFAFFSGRDRLAKTIALSSVLFLLISSWINEEFIPTPYNNWLAYSFRFSSTVYVVCLAVAGMVLIRSLPSLTAKLPYKLVFVSLAVISVTVSAKHLIEVREAYARFDPPARAYAAKLFAHQRPVGIVLPRSSWLTSATAFRRYGCLTEPDCNPEGTLFRNNGGDLYPIRLISRKRIWPSNPTAAPANAFDSGEGYARGQFSRPRGIALDADGNFYVADSGNSRVQKFDADGNYIFEFGKFGEGEGEFRDPNGVAVDAEGNIYVVDGTNHTLMRFGADGRFQKQWKGPYPGFNVPIDIGIGTDNKLFIVDRGGARIAKFDPSTEEFSSWGASGKGDGQFERPTGIAVGKELVFVADNGNGRVQVFDLDGRFLRQWQMPAWDKHMWYYPDLAFDEDNQRVYVTSGKTQEILIFDTFGKFVNRFGPGPQIELSNASSVVLSATNQRKRLIVVSTGSDAMDHGDPAISAIDLTSGNTK